MSWEESPGHRDPEEEEDDEGLLDDWENAALSDDEEVPAVAAVEPVVEPVEPVTQRQEKPLAASQPKQTKQPVKNQRMPATTSTPSKTQRMPATTSTPSKNQRMPATTSIPSKQTPANQRMNARKQKEREELERKALEKLPKASALEQRERELAGDLANAADLLSAASVHPRAAATVPAPAASGPTRFSELAVFNVGDAKGYTNLRKTLVPVVNDLHKSNKPQQHADFIIELCRDLCEPLQSEHVQKVLATLTAIANEKFKSERAKRLGARGAKPQIKQASAKGASASLPHEDDDFGDDDFM